MLTRLKILFISDTAKDTSIVFLGTAVNVIAGGLFFIVTPRLLGPADYGLFSTVVATGLMAAAIANFGIDTGILRFARGDSTELHRILSVAFKSYLFLGAAVAFLGFFLSYPLAKFLDYPEMAPLLKIAFLANLFLLLTNYFVAGLQAKREFAKASLVNISSNLARLFLLIAAAYFFTVGLYFVTALFFLVTIVSVALGKIFLPFEIQKTDKESLFSFHKYNLWIALSLIIASIPFDNYFLLKLAGARETGLYAAPFKVLAIAYQFGGNFTRVLAPRFASFENDQKLKDFALKIMPFPLIFVIGLSFLILLSRLIVTLLFGQNYLEAVPVVAVLTLGFIFFFAATIPSSIILYYFGKSNISFVITLLRYLVFILLLVVLVPTQKAYGAALSFTLSELVNFLLMTGYVAFKFSKNNGKS